MKTTNNDRSLAFRRIKAGLDNAIAHARGQKLLTVREVELPNPPEPMTAAHHCRGAIQYHGARGGK